MNKSISLLNLYMKTFSSKHLWWNLAGNVINLNHLIHFKNRKKPVKTFIHYQIKLRNYSHSTVAGGLLVMSYTTRLIPSTSFVIRLEILSNKSNGILAQSAVTPSTEWMARIPIV